MLILFADDITILLSHSNPDDLVENIHTVFETLSTWFKTILSFLNLEKTEKFQKTKNISSTFCKSEQFQMFHTQNFWV